MTGRFSPFILKALIDTITGGGGNDTASPIGIYRSATKIEQFFLDCGIDMRIARQAAAAWDADEQLKRIILKVCDPREYFSEPDMALAVREHLNRVLEPDGLARSSS